MFDINTLALSRGFPKSVLSHFHIDRRNRINGVVATYTGKSYLLHGDDYVIEIDEKQFLTRRTDLVRNIFPGVPQDIESIFRYDDGKLYFFRNGSVYIFSEFYRKVLDVRRTDISIFRINCHRNKIVDRIKNVLSDYIVYPKNVSIKLT